MTDKIKLVKCYYLEVFAPPTRAPHLVVYEKTTVESDGDTFIHDNTPKCQALWEMAAECIFKLVDKSDGSNNEYGEDTKISYSYQTRCVL
jgi:hypothetical protein